MVDERNTLVQLIDKSAAQEKHLIAINDKLARLGFLYEDREPLYQDLLRAWHDVRYTDRPPAHARADSESSSRHEVINRAFNDQGGKSVIYVKRDPALIPESVFYFADTIRRGLDDTSAINELLGAFPELDGATDA